MSKFKKTPPEFTKSHQTTRSFSYQKKEVQLNFSLTIDGKSQVRDFLQCLQEASKDLTELLEQMEE